MTKVLICGDLVWAEVEAKEMFAGLAEIIVRVLSLVLMCLGTKLLVFCSEWTLPTGLIY